MKDSLHSACTAYFRLRQIEETRIQSLGWEDPPEKEMQLTSVFLGFPGGTSSKESACQCRRLRDRGSIPGSGRSPGGGHGNPLQYSCQDNPMDRPKNKVSHCYHCSLYICHEVMGPDDND